jgi:sigma-54 dependent transcriptional regulator, acetoin dehydrogenase operon transcriptional activator AcoR
MDLVIPGAVFPARVPAIRDSGIIMLMPDEIRYAESAGHVVWLETDQGRLQAVLPGFENVTRRLLPLGFLRVHRRFVVNVGRIRRVDRSTTGSLTLSTAEETQEAIPVSRRNEARVREVLGI